jgi:uncharacterized protein YdiU (UPF0061 family)
MAYAGHQYGFPAVLGDGRALLVGEWEDPKGLLTEIHLKGSGPTAYARGGDGRATLRSVWREYLVSESLHALGIPVSRSLWALESSDRVWRDYPRRGGLLVRTAPHHGRIGHLEWGLQSLSPAAYRTYVAYMLQCTCSIWNGDPLPSLKGVAFSQDLVHAFLQNWSEKMADLLARWSGLGFVHGVLNTDNISLLAITLDLGPCAFLNQFQPSRSFSSIDHGGRYAFGQQASVMQWNLGILLSCLMPLLIESDRDTERVMDWARQFMRDFELRCQANLRQVHLAKLGLNPQKLTYSEFARQGLEDWLTFLEQKGLDYNHAYLNLERIAQSQPGPEAWLGFTPSLGWAAAWWEQWNVDSRSSLQQMQAMNASMIPRNHRVEEALDAWEFRDDSGPFDRLLRSLQKPYDRTDEQKILNQPPSQGDADYRTFCGT